MIVVLLIGLFFYATTLFTSNSQTNKQKSDRLVNLIADTLQWENSNIFLGKMPLRDWKITDHIEITFDKNITGGISTVYYSWSSEVLSSGSIRFPFFDNDPQYKIVSLVWTWSSVPAENGLGATVMIRIDSDGMTFSGGGLTRDKTPQMQITAWYLEYKSIISVDKRVGKIEVTHLAPGP